MKLTKDAVIEALRTISAPGEGKNIVDSGGIQNVLIFEDQVDLDVVLKNPSLQARKKMEVEILKAIHEKICEKIKIPQTNQNI